MRAQDIRGAFLEGPEAQYGLYNFQPKKWLDQAVELLTNETGPKVLVLAGEKAIGRSYFCDALRFQMGKEHDEALTVWHLDLEGFEPDGEDPLGRYLLHLLDDQERRTEEKRSKTFDALTALARTLSDADWSAAILSLLWQFEDPLEHFGEVLAKTDQGHPGTKRSERELLQMLLDELTRTHKLLLHVIESTQIRHNYCRWLTTQAVRNPNLFLAISCRPEDSTDQLLPLDLLPEDPLRFDFEPLDRQQLREALELRFASGGCPDELVGALLRYSDGFPARIALKALDLVKQGAITDLPTGDSIAWQLADEGLASQALAHGFASDVYAPIEELIAEMPRLGRELREFLLLAALCRGNVPAQLLFAKLELSEDDADELTDVIDDHLIDKLGLFWDLGQRHPAFPGLWVYKFCNPILPGGILDQVNQLDREMEAASLMPFLQDRLHVYGREVARLFLSVAAHLGEREQEIYRRQLQWWIGTDEAEQLKSMVQAEIESGRLRPDLVWTFLNASEDWPAYRRLALLDAYIDAQVSGGDQPALSYERTLQVHLLRGSLLLQLGRYAESLSEAEAILRVVKPQTVEESQGLLFAGICCQRLGEYARSSQHLNQALLVCRELLGSQHLLTLAVMDALAGTLLHQGKLGEARGLQEEVLAMNRRALGEEHPSTLISMNNLAETLWAQGDASGARELLESALAMSCRVLGEEHPSTLRSMNNLAEALTAQGDSSGARKLLESALAVSRRVLGEEHPGTLSSMHNLCCIQEESNEMKVDRSLVEELLSGVRKLPDRAPIRVAAEASWLK